ncbi:leucine zipper domain-containing protein, partial [Massilia sp. GCM10023247]|uniref:leucine zipper domain-containing protein n=1 Tax=Massilia sp. GCM10023247 TaxID=3252643 RepID=UPI003623BE1C
MCRAFGVSPKTGYMWIARYRQEGPAGLGDRSCQPLNSPNRSNVELEAQVLALHEQ